MKKLIILSLIAATVGMMSCKKEEIMEFDASRPTIDFFKTLYIPGESYTDIKYDTIPLESIFYIGQGTVDFKIPVRMSGVIVDQDREYNVRLVAEKCYGELKEGEHYTLDTKQILHAGMYADSAIIKVNVDKLREDNVSGILVIEHVPSEAFSKGLDFYQSIGVRIMGGGFTSQPYFWNRNKLDDYGGVYSKIKAEKYVELNKIPNDDWLETNKAKLYAYGKRTYEWFRDNPTFDDNGNRVEFKGSIIYE